MRLCAVTRLACMSLQACSGPRGGVGCGSQGRSVRRVRVWFMSGVTAQKPNHMRQKIVLPTGPERRSGGGRVQAPLCAESSELKIRTEEYSESSEL